MSKVSKYVYIGGFLWVKHEPYMNN